MSFAAPASEERPSDAARRGIGRNTLWSLAGNAGPLAVALLAIPFIIRGLSAERFGLLNLIWVVVGYFGLFDMGIGRATTKFAAEHLARNEIDRAGGLVWSSLAMLAGLGLAGSIVLAASASWITAGLLRIPPELRSEALRALVILAFAVPLVLCSAGLRGVLEAQQKFQLITFIRLPVMIATIAAPLVVMAFTHDLAAITALLVLCRVAEFLLLAVFALRSVPGLARPRGIGLTDLKRLLGFGGWMTVSNIIGPLMTYLDRFLISGVMTIAAVAYYATPYDLANRLAVIPGSIAAVLFPAFTARAAVDPQRLTALYKRAITSVLFILTPVVLLLIIFADQLLTLWLGADFSLRSTSVLQVLLAGVLFNAAAQISFTMVHALGRPDLTSKLHLAELPLYLAALWMLVSRFGIIGAAIASAIRVVLDLGLLSWTASRMLSESRRNLASLFGTFLAVAGLLAAAGAAAHELSGTAQRAAALAVIYAVLLAMYQRPQLGAGE